ncbi:hypothetical protein EBU95_11505 [bacterium]|nr:hypothetical protein [bacterium]
MFISKFCKQKNITVDSYISDKTNNIYTYLLHLKNRDINIYSLFGFADLETSLKKSDLEVLRFMFDNNFLENISLFKIKFLNSKKCKAVVDNGLQIIKNNFKKELNTA